MTAQSSSSSPSSVLPSRSASRYSNCRENYVYPHSDIHPLTLHATHKSRFITQSNGRDTPLTQRNHTDTQTSPPSRPVSALSSCPSQVNLLTHAPLVSHTVVFSVPVQPVSSTSSTWNVSHNASVIQTSQQRLLQERQLHVQRYRQQVAARVQDAQKRRKQEEEQRRATLPVLVQQLLYERYEILDQQPTAFDRNIEHPPGEEREEKERLAPFQTQPEQSTQLSVNHPAPPAAVYGDASGHSAVPSPSLLSVPFPSRVSALSRDEQRKYQRKIIALASEQERHHFQRTRRIERQNASRNTSSAHEPHTPSVNSPSMSQTDSCESKEQMTFLSREEIDQLPPSSQLRLQTPLSSSRPVSASQPLSATLPAVTSATSEPSIPPIPTHTTLPPSSSASSEAPTPKSRSISLLQKSTRHLQPLSELQQDIADRLSRLGVQIAPLCRCSDAGWQGMGTDIVHHKDCVYYGHERDYFNAMMRFITTLEKAQMDHEQRPKMQQRSSIR